MSVSGLYTYFLSWGCKKPLNSFHLPFFLKGLIKNTYNKGTKPKLKGTIWLCIKTTWFTKPQAQVITLRFLSVMFLTNQFLSRVTVDKP